MNTKNPNQTKDKQSGKFKTVIKQEKTMEDNIKYILDTKQGLYEGLNDIDRIKKAYYLITGIQTPTNQRVMRLAITSFSEGDTIYVQLRSLVDGLDSAKSV